jgi:hypothetical protein
VRIAQLEDGEIRAVQRLKEHCLAAQDRRLGGHRRGCGQAAEQTE